VLNAYEFESIMEIGLQRKFAFLGLSVSRGCALGPIDCSALGSNTQVRSDQILVY